MQDGDFIEIEYTGKIKESGEIFDVTDEKIAKERGIHNEKATYGPIKIILGENFVVKGLEEELKKMNAGEQKEITVSPEKSFGNRDPKFVKTVPQSEFKKQNVTPAPGLVVDFGNMKAKIQSVNSGRVRLDFNHPLAGRDLVYDVKINKKIEDKNEKIKSILEFFGAGKDNFNIKENVLEVEEKETINEKSKEKIAEMLKKHLKFEKVNFVKSY